MVSAQSIHLRSFHQVRALCLLALIVVHAVSFTNRQVGLADLSWLPAFPLFFFLAGLNAVFLLLAGIAFRLHLTGKMLENRILLKAGSGIWTLLVLLSVVEMIKNLALYHTPVSILTWDFLKTLMVAWLVIALCGLVSVYLLLIPAVGLSCGFNFFLPSVSEWAWAPTSGMPELAAWNSFHTQCLWVTGILLSWLAWQVHSLAIPRIVKLAAWACLSVLVFVVVRLVARYQTPNLDAIALGKNWLLYGLIGDPSGTGLFPVGPWAPSVWLGFLATHFVLARPEFFASRRPYSYLGVSALACLVLGYIWFGRHWAWLTGHFGPTLWSFSYGLEAGFSFDLFKMALTVLLFSSFWVLGENVSMRTWNGFAERFSRATFWVYVAITGWTSWLAGWLSQFQGLGIGFSMAINILTALLLAWLVSKTLDRVSSVRLAVRVKRWPG